MQKRMSFQKCLFGAIFLSFFSITNYVFAQCTDTNISTIAGNGTRGYNGDDIAATEANLSDPHDIAFDSAGNLYIADQENNRVRKVDLNTGIITTIAGTGAIGYNGDNILAINAQVHDPSGLAFDSQGNLYISDFFNSRVRRVDSGTGIITTVAGTGMGGYNGDNILAINAQISGPSGLFIDAADNLYIADQNNNRIRRVDSGTGIISTVAGSGVRGYNGDNILATTADLDDPFDVELDNEGNIYIADQNNHRVRKVDVNTGIITTIAGTGVAGYNGDNILAINAQFDEPNSVVFDAQGDMYISDTFNNRIRKVDMNSGIISTFAGNGTVGYNGDDIPASSASLRFPLHILFDSNGNLFIADQNNDRIRKVGNCLPAPIPSFGAVRAVIFVFMLLVLFGFGIFYLELR